MFWTDIFWLIAGVTIGFLVGFKSGIKSLIPNIRELGRLVSYHRSSWLRILQREMANVLIRKDPQRFLKTYEKVHEEFNSIKSGDAQVLKAKLLLLTEKYQQYEDFELINTRDYILYADAFRDYSTDEVESRYSDIVMFQSLQSTMDTNWSSWHSTSEKNLEYLKEYVRRVIDTQFRQKLEKAIYEFYIHKQQQPDLLELETTEFTIKDGYDCGEHRCGIHLKSSDEFGVYSLFFSGDDKMYESYYRSDEGFKKTEVLRVILTDEPV